jgi:hypothetical protein
MPKAIEVFTPNDLPTFTYVERKIHKFEDRLREALAIPKMIVSLSGPSKSGKTVLVNKVIESDNLIPLSGASIRASDDLWAKVLAWMDVPTERVETTGSKLKAEVSGQVGGKAGIPLLAEGKVEGGGSIGGETIREMREKVVVTGLREVIKEIGGSSFTVFVDDFHYIPKEVQKEIGKQIKEAAENGVRICTASVPHRSDDVGTEEELEQIAYRGFQKLNVDVAPAIVKRLTAEAFGSPQLMQAICLHFCFENNIPEAQPEQRRVDIDFVTLQSVLERTSTLTDFSSMISALHSGPRQRGVERKVFDFTDGSQGDVYRCVLLAMKADPPRLSFPYDEILRRARAVSKNESPTGSSVAQALMQMEKLAGTVQEAPVIEWDEDVLDIVEPYFLFFLRCSPYLQKLAQAANLRAVSENQEQKVEG